MTERKPPHMSFDSWIDAQIREAQERGEFDDLPGKGKPLQGLDGNHDEMWWVRQFLAREGVEYLPPPMAVRRDAERLLASLGEMRSEASVRAAVTALNERIREVNRKPAIDGPPTTMMPLDVEVVVERWRSARPTPA